VVEIAFQPSLRVGRGKLDHQIGGRDEACLDAGHHQAGSRDVGEVERGDGEHF
jgi:hypothetical protein